MFIATFNQLHLSDYWNFEKNEKLSLLIQKMKN